MGIRLFITGVAALALASCEAPAAESAATSATAPSEAAQAGFATRTVGTHSVTGVLLAFEDSGFPMYSLEVGPAGATVGDEDNLSMLVLDPDAGGPVDPATIRPLIGQTVAVGYAVTADTGMVDLLVNGVSILPQVEGDPAPPADAKTIDGILSGADTDSGDLPSELRVTAPDGTSVTFEAFVFGEMTSANGRTVTLRYDDGFAIELVSIAPANPG